MCASKVLRLLPAQKSVRVTRSCKEAASYLEYVRMRMISPNESVLKYFCDQDEIGFERTAR